MATKLRIWHNGDISVGDYPESWLIELPFNYNEQDTEALEWFKDKQFLIYKEFSNYKLFAEYE